LCPVKLQILTISAGTVIGAPNFLPINESLGAVSGDANKIVLSTKKLSLFVANDWNVLQ
jgi:hypothetical protein